MRNRSSVMLLIVGLVVIVWVLLHLETKMRFPNHQQTSHMSTATQASSGEYGR